MSEVQLDDYDAIISVSGDGILHELVNGLAQHKVRMKAFRMPIATIPAGSGNGVSLNILGVKVRPPCSSSIKVAHLFFRTVWTLLLLR